MEIDCSLLGGDDFAADLAYLRALGDQLIEYGTDQHLAAVAQHWPTTRRRPPRITTAHLTRAAAAALGGS